MIADRLRGSGPASRLVLAVTATALVTVLAAPTPAGAQQCVGNPNFPGQFSVGGYATLQDAGTEYGVSSTANLASPAAIGARLGTLDLDGPGDLTVASAFALFELPLPRFTACPFAEIRWGTGSEPVAGASVDVDQWDFPLGVSAGMRFPVGQSFELLPSGRTGLMYRRTTVGPSSHSSTEFFVDAGATFLFVPLFARGQLGFVTGDDSDVSFEVSAGVSF